MRRGYIFVLLVTLILIGAGCSSMKDMAAGQIQGVKAAAEQQVGQAASKASRGYLDSNTVSQGVQQSTKTVTKKLDKLNR